MVQSDKELVNQILEGDIQSFETLVNEFKERVMNICYSYTNDLSDAEDISQEVFVEIFKSLRKFKGESSLSTWVFRIASNKSLDHIRKQKRTKRGAGLTSYINDFKNNDWSVDHMNHPDEEMMQNQRKELLYKGLSKLSGRQKEAFVLTQIEGMNQQMVSKMMNTSVKSVESLVMRARKKLKAILEKQIKEYL
ncbi:RNA polymerase sigma factor [Saccharicrinis fermentans]|uniref:Sigma-24 n=1 Tax=Saccharicrinis fermentans DSM 9555 = JCM 21142 TaxID=869213 RepID=W7Y2U2_9BACT|nr:RNA polymerase sigma factor [Saccharicrinis fermentans]GAF02307.1 sigma-24 [Saccharicrinis fermentans DSM 9555 = JCM 21142]